VKSISRIGPRAWRIGIVGTALAVLAACGTSDNTTGQPSASAGAKALRIAYIQTGPFDYYVRGVDGAKAAASKLNVTLDVFNSDGKPEKEIANVEDAISRGVDGLIVF
jgi:ABC-type sugar transport system substrate-binding protein